MSEKTQARKAIDELVSDGEWHSREEIMAVATKLVPPGTAMRTYSWERDYIRHRDGVIAPRAPITDPARSGARRVIGHKINNQMWKGRWEREIRNGIPYYRINPERRNGN